MRGNVYISLTTEAYKAKMPPLLAEKHKEIIHNEDGTTEEKTLTFEEWCASKGKVFGQNPIKIKDGNRNLYVIEMDASHLNGEVRELKNLGVGMEYPLNSVLTASEASELISKNSKE